MEKLNDSITAYRTKMNTILSEGKSSFFSTSGFASLDDEINGYFYGELIIVAGRPGMGVSSFLMETAINVALNNNLAVGFISVGVHKHMFQSKVMGILSGVESNNILKHQLTDEDLKKLDLNEQITSMPLYLHFPETTNIEDIITHLETEIEAHQIKYIIIDDIQSITSSERRSFRSRYDELNEVIRKLKTLASKTNTILICASRLSRKVDESTDKYPLLSHLRESGLIEEMADKVMMLYRPEYYGIHQDACGNPTAGILRLIIAKNNSGRVVEINMYSAIINGNFRIKELEKYEELMDEDWKNKLEQMINEQSNQTKKKPGDAPF